MELTERSLKMLETDEGNVPFEEWYEGLKDRRTRLRIRARLTRLQSGNFGDFKGVGEGVFELRIFFGPGYRVYFALSDKTVVVLLGGGDKGSQESDIRKAHVLWRRYEDEAQRFQRDF